MTLKMMMVQCAGDIRGSRLRGPHRAERHIDLASGVDELSTAR